MHPIHRIAVDAKYNMEFQVHEYGMAGTELADTSSNKLMPIAHENRVHEIVMCQVYSKRKYTLLSLMYVYVCAGSKKLEMV